MFTSKKVPMLFAVLAGLITVIGLLTNQEPLHVAIAQTSPLPTPTLTPDRCIDAAKEYVATEQGIAVDHLIAGTYISSEGEQWFGNHQAERIEFPTIEQTVCVVKVYDTVAGSLQTITLNQALESVNLEEVR